jgi:DNA invertase Pin-like site-specific DNA recombinase
MKYGYARVSTDGQSLDAQVKQLRATRAECQRFMMMAGFPAALWSGQP